MTRSRAVIMAFALLASLLVVTATPAAATSASSIETVSEHTTTADFEAGTLSDIRVTDDSVIYNAPLDSFEDGDIDEFGGDTGDYSTSSNFADDGTLSLRGEGGGDARIHTTDTKLTTDQRYRIWVRPDTAATAEFALFSQSEVSGANAYLLQLDITNNQIQLFDFDGSFNNLGSASVTINADTNYQIETIKHSSNDTVEFLFLDASGTELARVTASDTSYSSGGFGFRTVNGIAYYDNVSRIGNQTGTYISANHTAENVSQGTVDLRLVDANATVTWQYSDGGGPWTTEDTSVYTTNGTKTADLSGAPASADAWRVNVTFDATARPGFGEVKNDSVEAFTQEPVVDNSSATPTGSELSTATPDIEIDINDSDFPLAQADEINASLYIDGQFEGFDTRTTNGTVSVTASSLSGGEHEYYWVVNDSYGHSITSQTFTISTPGNITIRNVTEPHDVIDTATADIILAGSNDTVDRQSVTDGNVSLAGLPTDESYILVIEADNYHRRTVIVEDVFSQSDVYLLNTSFTSIENTFNIDDQTGQFEGDETEIILQKPINRSVYDSSFAAEYQWVDVAGDRIGADGSYTVDLEDGERYRIIVDNNNGDRRVLGEYQAETGGIVTLRIGELTFNIGPDSATYEYDASFSSSAVKFNYSDPDSNTSSLTVKIFEVANESNEIYNQTHTSLGTLSVSQPISGDQVNTTWVVEFTGTRGGEAIDGRVIVGQSGLSPGVPLSDAWKNRIAFSLLLIITGLTAGGFNAETGSLVAALTGGILWWTGWLPAEIGGGVVALALFVAGAMTLSTRGGEEIQ